jgi:hypothetical protein
VTDTSLEILNMQREIYRRMTPGERLLMASELSELARGLALANLRAENPGIDERGAITLWVRRLHGVDLSSPDR